MFSLKKVHGKVLKLPATTQWESMETTFITGNDTDLKIKQTVSHSHRLDRLFTGFLVTSKKVNQSNGL